jgi:cytochrome c553
MKFRLALTVLGASLSFIASGADLSKADPAKGQKIAGQVCIACHAADGNSTIAQNPVLAGQHAAYLYRQMVEFKKNTDRRDPAMSAMVANLNDDDFKNLAVYYASQKPKARSARNKELADLGEKIYRGGIADKGVPACAGCHGANGNGIPVQYPRLAGQHAEYTDSQMKKWRTEDRKNDPNKMMRMVAAKMSDKEIQAVSDYIAGLR